MPEREPPWETRRQRGAVVSVEQEVGAVLSGKAGQSGLALATATDTENFCQPVYPLLTTASRHLQGAPLPVIQGAVLANQRIPPPGFNELSWGHLPRRASPSAGSAVDTDDLL